jgi:hypothetical protein
MDNTQQYKKLEKKLNPRKRRQLNNLSESEMRKIERLHCLYGRLMAGKC